MLSRAVRVASQVERTRYLLVHRLDRDRANLVVARGLKQRLGVAAVGLVATHVAVHVVGGQQPHVVAALLELAGPVVGAPAGLEEHGGRWLLREERQEPGAREPALQTHLARPVRDGDLKYGLCEINGDGRRLHTDSS